MNENQTADEFTSVRQTSATIRASFEAMTTRH